MEGKNEACHDERKDCLLINGKRVVSFLKVMIDACFLEILHFPPKFARSVSHLKDQETYLEDSSGRQWSVTVCNHDGELAIDQGWLKFSSEHGLKVGDFLVFHYIPSDQHFIVQIFGSDGCENINFCRDTGKGKTAICVDESFGMIDRDAQYDQEDGRLCLDLSSFEMPASKPIAQGTSSRENSKGKKRARTCLEPIPAEDISLPDPKDEKSKEASQFGEEHANSEPADSRVAPSHNAVSYSCLVVVNGRDFLELPESWEENLLKRAKKGRMIIFLRGPDKRIWPVLYHHTRVPFKKYHHTGSGFDDVLTCGWKQFTAAYGVNAGDLFLFELANQLERIFDVRKISLSRSKMPKELLGVDYLKQLQGE